MIVLDLKREQSSQNSQSLLITSQISAIHCDAISTHIVEVIESARLRRARTGSWSHIEREESAEIDSIDDTV